MRPGSMEFFSRKQTTFNPQPSYMDVRKPSHPFQQEKILNEAMLALHAAKKSLYDVTLVAEKIVAFIKKEAASLPTAYQQRQLPASGFFSYFKSASPEPEEINFITSIASSLTLELHQSPIYLRTLMGNISEGLRPVKEDTRQIKAKALMMASILDGAYLSVMEKIEAPYRNAWIYKDPTVDPLYTEVAMRIGKKTDAQKIDCLMALQNYLKTPAAQATVAFGSKKPGELLAAIQEQIDSLSLQGVSAKLK